MDPPEDEADSPHHLQGKAQLDQVYVGLHPREFSVAESQRRITVMTYIFRVYNISNPDVIRKTEEISKEASRISSIPTTAGFAL